MMSVAFIVFGVLIGLCVPWIFTHLFTGKGTGAGSKRPGRSALEQKIWQQEELQFILRLHESLAAATDRPRAIHAIIKNIHNFIYVKRTVLILYNKEYNCFYLGSGVGVEDDLVDHLWLHGQESIAGFIAKHKQPLVVHDLSREHYLLTMNKEEYLQHAFIGVPLLYDNELLGIIYVCDKLPQAKFSLRDVDFMTNIGKMAAVALQNIQLFEQLQDGYLKTITTLAATIDARDHYTERHSENVTRYTLAIAHELGYPTLQRETLRRAAMLHDIGKIGIRDNVLLKTERLTNDEYEQIKQHPVIGERIISSLYFLRLAANLIRHHHERYDGNGYPDQIAGDTIELGARILAVADSFDAMTSDRPYRKALTAEEALKELERNKNTQFDPRVVDAAKRVLSEQKLL